MSGLTEAPLKLSTMKPFNIFYILLSNKINLSKFITSISIFHYFNKGNVAFKTNNKNLRKNTRGLIFKDPNKKLYIACVIFF